MKFCLLENKKEAWYQRLCTIETIILKRRKKCLLYYQLCSIVSCSVWIQLCCQSCVFRCCFKPWHLSSFTLMGPHSDANNYTLHCNKIKSLLTYYRCFFLSFLTLCLLKTFLLYSSTATSLYMYLAFSLLYGRTFLQSNWENCEHQKYFCNVIVLQDESLLGVRN